LSKRRSMKRLQVAVLLSIVLLFALYLDLVGREFPAAVICPRERPTIEIPSTAWGGHFEKRYVGPCVLYTYKSCTTPTGGGD
jgi:hypothetical protein